MEEGIYEGKGFDLVYYVSKISDEEYQVDCLNTGGNIHYFKGNKLKEQIMNFVNNHELIDKED